MNETAKVKSNSKNALKRTKSIKAKINNAAIKDIDEEVRRVNDTVIAGFHFIVSQQGRVSYYIFYRHKGKQVNYKIGTAPNLTPQQARDLAKQKLGEVANGTDVQLEKKQHREQTEKDKLTTLEAFLNTTYLPYQEARNPKTALRIIKSIKAGFPHLLNKQLKEIDASSIELWRNEKRKSGMKEATINGYVSSLKAALNRAVDWELLDQNRLSKIKKLKSDNKRTRFLSGEELTRLYEALEVRNENVKSERVSANQYREHRGYPELEDLRNKRFVDHLEPIVLLAMFTGMRKGEILHLKWADVDFIHKVITIQPENAKSGKRRHIPMNNTVFNTLEVWKQESQSVTYVFEGDLHTPLQDIKKSWGNLIKSAQIEEFRFHDLRHHFASSLVMKSVDLNTVRELLGHSSIEMTLRYAHLAPDHKAAAIGLLDS